MISNLGYLATLLDVSTLLSMRLSTSVQLIDPASRPFKFMVTHLVKYRPPLSSPYFLPAQQHSYLTLQVNYYTSCFRVNLLMADTYLSCSYWLILQIYIRTQSSLPLVIIQHLVESVCLNLDHLGLLVGYNLQELQSTLGYVVYQLGYLHDVLLESFAQSLQEAGQEHCCYSSGDEELAGFLTEPGHLVAPDLRFRNGCRLLLLLLEFFLLSSDDGVEFVLESIWGLLVQYLGRQLPGRWDRTVPYCGHHYLLEVRVGDIAHVCVLQVPQFQLSVQGVRRQLTKRDLDIVWTKPVSPRVNIFLFKGNPLLCQVLSVTTFDLVRHLFSQRLFPDFLIGAIHRQVYNKIVSHGLLIPDPGESVE